MKIYEIASLAIDAMVQLDSLRQRVNDLEAPAACVPGLRSVASAARACAESCFPFLRRASPHTYYPYEAGANGNGIYRAAAEVYPEDDEANLYEPLANVASGDVLIAALHRTPPHHARAADLQNDQRD